MSEKIQVKCSKCGKDYEVDEKLASWCEKNNKPLVCQDCFKSGGTGKTGYAKKEPNNTAAKSGIKVAKADVNATMFRKAYDELVAEFSDIKEEVAPYLGGWASTIVINRSR